MDPGGTVKRGREQEFMQRPESIAAESTRDTTYRTQNIHSDSYRKTRQDKTQGGSQTQRIKSLEYILSVRSFLSYTGPGRRSRPQFPDSPHVVRVFPQSTPTTPPAASPSPDPLWNARDANAHRHKTSAGADKVPTAPSTGPMSLDAAQVKPPNSRVYPSRPFFKIERHKRRRTRRRKKSK